jgi:hypothetical protein
MSDSALRRFLELVIRELGADDARAELGGREPVGPGVVSKSLSEGWRVVAVFDQPPTDPGALDVAREKLEKLAQTFTHTLADVHPPAPVPSAALPGRRLDDALESLRARTGGVAVVLIDGNSPVLWGSSEGQRELLNVDDLARVGAALGMARDRGVSIDQLTVRDADAVLSVLRSRGIERGVDEALTFLIARDQEELVVRHRLLTALAIAAVRGKMHRGDNARSVHHDAQFGFIARGLASIYSVVVVFAGPFSELHVESAILHALPMLEELLFALPPVDPPPSRGQVIRLRPR